MEHQPETHVKKTTMDRSKMDHSTKHRGHNPSMGMEGHDHAMMIADFKRRCCLNVGKYSCCCYQCKFIKSE
jgi:Cu2+-exporting ATPase